MSWYLGVLKKYAVFDGRARRKEYWMFILINIIVSFVVGFIDGILEIYTGEELFILSTLYVLILFLPTIAVQVRRLHDTNRSGWWVLLIFVPILRIVLLVFLIQDSDPNPNKYGNNPKTSEPEKNVLYKEL